MDHIKILRACDNIENNLSLAAACPFIGTIPAAGKVVLGISQFIECILQET